MNDVPQDAPAQDAPRELADSDLMRLAQAGRESAFEELVRRHQRKLYGVSLHLLRDRSEAEDVTQESFIRAYRALGRFDGRSQPYTWLYRITVNLSLNRIRSRKRSRHSTPLDDPRLDGFLTDEKATSSPHKRLDHRRMGASLLDAVDALSDTLRTTLVLVVMEGLSHAEAGDVLGCPEGTVAWRIHEGRKKIRQYLELQGYEMQEGAVL